MTDTRVGTDGLVRPVWAASGGDMQSYYDTEWGVPVTDEQGVFERLCLEGFQAGLSWRTILTKREAFRELFEGFEVEKVAAFTEDDVERLAADARIIRHRGKIRAAIGNAQATIALRSAGQVTAPGGAAIDLAARTLAAGQQVEAGLPALIWSFMPERTPAPAVLSDIPTQDENSLLLSKTLKKLGFKFIGPTSAYAMMEAIGVLDTHLVTSHRRGISGLWNEDGTRQNTVSLP